jgi:sigma-B regulation protein RsbU (phosphoserine phosphatase)
MVWNANLYGRATLNLVLRRELQAAYESLDRELSIVAEMQRSLLPRELPAIPTLEMAVHYQTSKRAGGDYYDFFPLPDGKWGLFLADVSGHGTPAAVVMAITHAIAHSYPSPILPPDEVLEYVNRKLTARYTGDTGTFVTAQYAVYDPRTRELAYSCAGHHMPRHRRGGRIVGLEGPVGLPLGIDPDERYESASVRLAPGDVLAFYTDGFTEAFNAGRQMFGAEGLDKALLGNGLNAQGLLESVLSAVDGFTQGKPPADDRTLLVIRVD